VQRYRITLRRASRPRNAPPATTRCCGRLANSITARRLAVAGCAHNYALRFVPHGCHPIRPYCGEHGLLWMPSGGLAEARKRSAAKCRITLREVSTTCLSCHTTWVTTGWLGATLSAAQHTWFRIPHHGSVCSDCHQGFDGLRAVHLHHVPYGTNCSPAGMSHPNVNGGNWYGPTICWNCHKN